MTGRDRSLDGRPRNARPRDALGRPLPRDAFGVPAQDDPEPQEPRVALAEVVALLTEGKSFRAHEVCEAQWKAADRSDRSEREFWQGLAQLCVGVTHLARGNVTGGHAVSGRAVRVLLAAGDRHGLTVASVGDQVSRYLAELRHAHRPVGTDALAEAAVLAASWISSSVKA